MIALVSVSVTHIKTALSLYKTDNLVLFIVLSFGASVSLKQRFSSLENVYKMSEQNLFPVVSLGLSRTNNRKGLLLVGKENKNASSKYRLCHCNQQV